MMLKGLLLTSFVRDMADRVIVSFPLREQDTVLQFDSEILMRKSYIYFSYPILPLWRISRDCVENVVVTVERRREMTQEAEKLTDSRLSVLLSFPSHICWFFLFLSDSSLTLFRTLFPRSMHMHAPDLSVNHHSFIHAFSPHKVLGYTERQVFRSWHFPLCPLETEERTAGGQRFLLQRKGRRVKPGFNPISVSQYVHKYILRGGAIVRCWDVGFKQSSVPAASSAAQSLCLSSRCLVPAWKHRDRQERGTG